MTGRRGPFGSVKEGREGDEDVAEMEENSSSMADYDRQQGSQHQTTGAQGQRNRDLLASLQARSLGMTSLVEENSPDSGKKRLVLDRSPTSRRRSQRLNSIKSSTVVDWRSSDSDLSGAKDAAAASDSGSDGGDVAEDSAHHQSSRQAGGKLKQRAMKRKKKGPKKLSLNELDDIQDKRGDAEYEPGENSDSGESLGGEEANEDEVEGEASSRDLLPQLGRKNTQDNRSKGILRPPKKRTISLNSPSAGLQSPSTKFSDFGGGNADDEALQQALALSMGTSFDLPPGPGPSDEAKGKQLAESPRSRNGNKNAQKRSNKRGKQLYFNQSEIDAFFVSIVGSKEGRLSTRHLETAASAHDFTWTKDELNEMIEIFDEDQDGQLNLEEFRSMALRCKLMEAC